MNDWLILLTLIPNVAFATGGLSAREIMTRNEDARKIPEFQCAARLLSTDSDKKEKVKEFSFWRKVQADGVHNNTLTRFHSPAEVRNEGILIVENTSGKNDVLLYLPAYKKVRRVESQQQSGSFMGSVFSYSDIATPHVDDYEYKILREETCPSGEASSILCTVIETKPGSDEIRERTGYSKSTVWIRQDNFMAVRGEYYNLQGELFKKMEAKDTRMVDPKGKKWLSQDLFIENLKTQESTRLNFSKVKVNSGLSDALFTQQNLQKVN